MFCNNCGASLPEKTAFCSNCGRPAQSSPAGVAQPTSAPSGSAAGAQPAMHSSTAPSTPPAGQGSSSAWSNVPPMAQPARQPSFARQQQTDGKATASLVLGILSLLIFSFIAGIPAVILGHLSRKSIRESMGRLKGDGMALAGLIMGYLSIATIPMILIIAAIAIPNLLRAKMEANNSSAAAVVRTVNTAQVTYSTTYPAKGYASDLATLGPGASNDCTAGSETHACLIDSTLGTGVRNGFRFSMNASCGSDGVCTDYVIVATPINASTGNRSFCSTADAVVRTNRQVPLVSPPTTVEECQAWLPI